MNVEDNNKKQTTSGNKNGVNRRIYLKMVATSAALTATTAGETVAVQAASNGYGESGYGQTTYGGSGFSVTTQEPTNIDDNSITINGELSNLNGADSADLYFEWRETGLSTWNTTTAQTLTSTDTFSESLSGIRGDTEYEYRAAGKTSTDDSATGTTVSFRTIKPLTVTTGSPSSIKATSATLNGSLDALGGASSVDCSLEWKEAGSDTWNSTPVQTFSAPGSVSADVSNLDQTTDYEYRTIAETDADSATGMSVSFSTAEAGTPTVSTESPSPVEATSATVNASLDELGEASSVDCYFEWRETGSSTWNTTTAQPLSNTGTFSENLSGLRESVEYEYRAVGDTSTDGSATGSIISFSTEGSGPVINRFSLSEAGRSDPHAEITVVWDVTDTDGDLDSVTISISDSDEWMTRTLDGSTASDVDSFKIESGDGQTFDVNFTVTSADGSTFDVKSVTA